MKTSILLLSLLFSAPIFAEDTTPPSQPEPTNPADPEEEEPEAPAFFASCEFKGQFASGCIDFLGANWTDENAIEYCQSQAKKGETVVLSQLMCNRHDYDSLCRDASDENAIKEVYVNKMPAFICNRYLNGELIPRPESGWPE